MFSRKRITRTVSSILIVLMLMVLIPFIDSGKVLAEPDKEDAKTIELHQSVDVGKGDGSKTMLFHAPYTMKYRFTLYVQSDERTDLNGYLNDTELLIYDSSLKLITSVRDMPHERLDLVVELNGNEDYYIYVDPHRYARDFSLCCEYDYEIELKVKRKADSDYKLMHSSFMSSFSYTYNELCDTYELDDSDIAKADLVIGSLPNGMKLNYEWYKTAGMDLESVGSPNSPITIQNSLFSNVGYKCLIKSTDGKFSDELYFKVNTLNTYTFIDGSKWAYGAFAYKPGEDRTITFPETIYSGNANDKTKYSFYDYYYASYANVQGDGPTVNIPDSWSGTLIFGDAYRGYNNRLRAFFLSFVFEDGAGIKAESGKTYQMNRQSFTGDYRQVIYRFTPETSGTYRFNTSNVKYGYSICAIFDSDRKAIATTLGDYIENETSYGYNQTFDINVELTGGKTYYIAIPAGYSDLSCDFSISTVSTSSNPSNPSNPSVPSTTGGTFEDFVERLYVVALGRASEAEGKAHWCKVVGNGSYSGADCARFFLTSPEFNGRNLNNEEYLKVLYKTFFDRDAAADPDGFNFWLSKIDEWGRGRVLEGFIDSTEWCNICASYGVKSGAMTAKATVASKNATAFASRLYTECLGREPEEGGLKYWSLSLTNLERTGTQAAKEFFYSPEFKDKNLGDDEYVTRLYMTFMGREPDDAGKAHWLNQLSSGAMNRDQVFDFFSTCDEFTSICNSYAIQR